jgi:hypothetical protein
MIHNVEIITNHLDSKKNNKGEVELFTNTYFKIKLDNASYYTCLALVKLDNQLIAKRMMNPNSSIIIDYIDGKYKTNYFNQSQFIFKKKSPDFSIVDVVFVPIKNKRHPINILPECKEPGFPFVNYDEPNFEIEDNLEEKYFDSFYNKNKELISFNKQKKIYPSHEILKKHRFVLKIVAKNRPKMNLMYKNIPQGRIYDDFFFLPNNLSYD